MPSKEKHGTMVVSRLIRGLLVPLVLACLVLGSEGNNSSYYASKATTEVDTNVTITVNDTDITYSTPSAAEIKAEDDKTSETVTKMTTGNTRSLEWMDNSTKVANSTDQTEAESTTEPLRDQATTSSFDTTSSADVTSNFTSSTTAKVEPGTSEIEISTSVSEELMTDVGSTNTQSPTTAELMTQSSDHTTTTTIEEESTSISSYANETDEGTTDGVSTMAYTTKNSETEALTETSTLAYTTENLSIEVSKETSTMANTTEKTITVASTEISATADSTENSANLVSTAAYNRENSITEALIETSTMAYARENSTNQVSTKAYSTENSVTEASTAMARAAYTTEHSANQVLPETPTTAYSTENSVTEASTAMASAAYTTEHSANQVLPETPTTAYPTDNSAIETSTEISIMAYTTDNISTEALKETPTAAYPTENSVTKFLPKTSTTAYGKDPTTTHHLPKITSTGLSGALETQSSSLTSVITDDIDITWKDKIFTESGVTSTTESQHSATKVDDALTRQSKKRNLTTLQDQYNRLKARSDKLLVAVIVISVLLFILIVTFLIYIFTRYRGVGPIVVDYDLKRVARKSRQMFRPETFPAEPEDRTSRTSEAYPGLELSSFNNNPATTTYLEEGETGNSSKLELAKTTVAEAPGPWLTTLDVDKKKNGDVAAAPQPSSDKSCELEEIDLGGQD